MLSRLKIEFFFLLEYFKVNWHCLKKTVAILRSIDHRVCTVIYKTKFGGKTRVSDKGSFCTCGYNAEKWKDELGSYGFNNKKI